jgi:hypothetical protein
MVVDQLTKIAYFIPFKEASDAAGLAYVIMRYIISSHGLPADIISNRGNTFISKFWKALTARLGINHKASTAYYL